MYASPAPSREITAHVKEAPWIRNTVQYHAGQSPPRRGADSTNHRVVTWQSPPPFSWPARGRVPWCQVSALGTPFHCYLCLNRGRLVTWVSQARTTQAGAAPVLGRDGMCPQPPRSARGEDQRSLFRHCAGQDAGCARPEPTQTARRHAGWCVFGGRGWEGCGEGVRGEPRRQSFVKLSRSINDKNSSFAQIGYLSFQRHMTMATHVRGRVDEIFDLCIEINNRTGDVGVRITVFNPTCAITQ